MKRSVWNTVQQKRIGTERIGNGIDATRVERRWIGNDEI